MTTDLVNRGGCPAPFFAAHLFPEDQGFIDGRLCQEAFNVQCCLPCPMADWVYPDRFKTVAEIANWICVAGAICCFFLLLSWAVLPVEKTSRHYLSISLTSAVMLMNLGFVIPLAAQPDECINTITPHDMNTSSVCGASGAMLLFGGFAAVFWIFLRALSLHLQICWQLVVGRNFMIFAQASGWGIPIIVIIVSLIFSGVSFRFGATCHINHENSLATFWIPILAFAAITVIIQFSTFGYCLKVYLASLGDRGAESTENSSLPTYSASVRTMSPRQAYRRVQHVVALQWRGITIVLIILADVIFFSVVFVFQDVTVHKISKDGATALKWAACLMQNNGDKYQCLKEARPLVVNEATISAVLILLAINGIWLLFLLGRWSMVLGWVELAKSVRSFTSRKEFVSVDARHNGRQDGRAYEMLSKEASVAVTPIDPAKTPEETSNGRHTPDYFGETARYHVPANSFSSPRPPQSPPRSPPPTWDARTMYGRNEYEGMNPLGMNRI